MEKLELLKEDLHAGATKFQFNKVDGSMRTAFGTLNPVLIDLIMKGQKYDKLKKIMDEMDKEEKEAEGMAIKFLDTFSTESAGKKEKKAYSGCQNYFDLEKLQFRTFKIENLI